MSSGGIDGVVATVHRPAPVAAEGVPYAGDDSFLFVRLRLRHADGLTGDGVTGRFLAAEVAHFLNEDLGRAVTGRDPLTEPGLLGDLAAKFNPRGMTGVVVSALSALDVAFHDLRAKAANQSVAAMLGGRRASAPVHVTCGFPHLSTGDLVAACGQEVAAGAGGVKVLVGAKGRSVEQDAARLAAVRDAIGPSAELIADANCVYDTESARALLRQTAGLNLAWFEEPVRGNDLAALASLAGDRIAPIGAGQMEQSARRFAGLRRAGVAVIQPNAVFAGGITAAVDRAREATEAGLDVAPGGGWDMVNLHWMCGALHGGAVELHRGHDRISRFFCDTAPTPAAGRLATPEGIGLGLKPDEAALTAAQV